MDSPFFYKDTIVFDGINADLSRCVSFLGAIDALCRNNVIELSRLRRVGGVGAGAVMALMLCCFATDPCRLCETIGEIFHDKYTNKASSYLSKIVACCVAGSSIPKEGGAFDLNGLLNRMGWSYDTTFYDIHRQTQCHLRLVAVDLTAHSTVYLDHIFTPNMSIIDALRICMCDPFGESLVVYDGREFASAWTGTYIRRIFEEYTDEYVVLCMLKSDCNGAICERVRLRIKIGGTEGDNKRRSIDAVVDASRNDIARDRRARLSSGKHSTYVPDTFCIRNIDPTLSRDTNERYQWLYNAGFNAVMETGSIM